MLNELSALDPSRSFEIAAAIVGVVAVSIAGFALAGAALWKVRAADRTAGWLLVAAGLVQPAAFLVVLPLAFLLGRSMLAVYGADESVMEWMVFLPACRTTIVLSLAVVCLDALVASAMVLLARRAVESR